MTQRTRGIGLAAQDVGAENVEEFADRGLRVQRIGGDILQELRIDDPGTPYDGAQIALQQRKGAVMFFCQRKINLFPEADEAASALQDPPDRFGGDVVSEIKPTDAHGLQQLLNVPFLIHAVNHI